MELQIISGGQTGIDTMALEVAKELNIPTGGTAAKGYRTENGFSSSLKDYGLVESFHANYKYRTRTNIIDSDGTIIFGDINSPGSRETVNCTDDILKPCLVNPSPIEMFTFINLNRIKILNVAGNRLSILGVEKLEYYRKIFKEGLELVINKENLHLVCGI